MTLQAIKSYKLFKKQSQRTNNIFKISIAVIFIYLVFTFLGSGTSGIYKNMPNDDFSYDLKSNGTYNIIYENRVTKSGNWHKEGDKIFIGEQTFEYKGNSFCEINMYKGEVCYYKQ